MNVHLGFAEQDLQTIEKLGQRAGQTKGQNSIHHYSNLGIAEQKKNNEGTIHHWQQCIHKKVNYIFN